MSSTESGENGDTAPLYKLIKIHILCPSVSPTSRFTIFTLTLDDTVATLREKIQTWAPTHPLPTEQRLIFRGRHFNPTADSSTLREVLAPIDVSKVIRSYIQPI